MHLNLEPRPTNYPSVVKLYDVIPTVEINTLIATTPQTSQILNNPEICGVKFQDLLSSALSNIIEHLYKDDNDKMIQIMKTSPIDVLYILRGGLNFDLHRSLTKITSTLPEVTFLSSQRFASNNGFDIGEASYQKWSIQDESLLCIGDISATATTVRHVLDRAIFQYNLEGKKPRGLLFLTIGTSEVIGMLEEYQEKLINSWKPNFQGTTVIFLEEIFSLYKGEVILSTSHLPFTDFFRKDFPSAFEFEDASLSKPVCFLERCAIYDGGSRAFEPRTYLSNLRAYWESLRKLNSNVNVIQLLQLKSNLMDYLLDFEDWLQKRYCWTKMNKEELVRLHERGQEAASSLTSRSLIEICEERLKIIKSEAETRYAERN